MTSREVAEQGAARWIAQRETGAWTEADAAAFDEWLNAATSHQVAYYRFHKVWKETGRLTALARGPLPASPLADAFEDGRSLTRGARAATWFGLRARTAGIAASVLLLAGAALFQARDHFFHSGSYSTAVGGLAAVPMEDGSRVMLNTDSRMRIDFSDHERRIELDKGEAYFEVAKDPARPFIVVAGSKRIVAVGTQFSVRREEFDVRVSVTEGLVRVESGSVIGASHGNEAPVLVPAGSIARLEGVDVLVHRKPISDIEQRLTWRSGRLTFRDTPLADAVAEFNRYNERKILIEDTAIAAIEVGGIFRATNLDPFIHLIRNEFAIRVEEKGDRIVLSTR